MLDAVLFDWGDTLMRFAYDEELVEAGHRAGLETLAPREGLPEPATVAAYFREHYEPLFSAPGTIEEIEYPGLVRELLGAFDVGVSDEELGRFLEAEHEAWSPARELGATTHALLESLRRRGLKLGLVSNAFDPGWLLRRDLDRMGISERIDAAVFSSEVGKRKPHPAIYETVLSDLDVAPGRALFVGDRLVEDVQGPAEVGMKTVQAVWFRADENPNGIEPDYQAFTPMDVLNIVERLRNAT